MYEEPDILFYFIKHSFSFCYCNYVISPFSVLFTNTPIQPLLHPNSQPLFLCVVVMCAPKYANTTCSVCMLHTYMHAYIYMVLGLTTLACLLVLSLFRTRFGSHDGETSWMLILTFLGQHTRLPVPQAHSSFFFFLRLSLCLKS